MHVVCQLLPNYIRADNNGILRTLFLGGRAFVVLLSIHNSSCRGSSRIKAHMKKKSRKYIHDQKKGGVSFMILGLALARDGGDDQ